MKAANLILLVFIGLAALAFCEERNDGGDEVEEAFDNDNLSEGDQANPLKNANDPFYSRRRSSWRRRRSYVRRRRSHWRRRRSYVRRRRSHWRRRRSYVRRRRSHWRRRRSYVRRRRSHWRRRRSYVRRRRSHWRRRRSYVRRRRSHWRRRRSYVRRRRSQLRRRRSALRRRRSYLRRRASLRRRRTTSRRRSSIGSSGRTHYDKCGRLCKVVNGRLTNCCRVRKEFESMSTYERHRYVKAYKLVSTKQPYKREYDKLIKMHQRYFNTKIHQRAEFLPWHRWFNLQMENLLRRVDCRITLPYWDWSLWSHAPWSRVVWHAKVGLGGNGRKSDKCVATGLFKVGAWKTATGQCLRREFRGTPPDAAQVAITLKEPNFVWFELMLRVNIHEGMHCFIGGTMCSQKSAEAPEFFLHHGFIDKIWADYQSQSRAKKFIFFSTINARMQGVPYKPRRLLDNNNLPGGVRVCYKSPTVNQARKIRRYLSHKTLKELERLRRLAFSRVPKSAKKMFRLTARERGMAKYLEKQAEKGMLSERKSVKAAKSLSSLENVEGFKIPRRRAYGDDEE